MTPAGRYAVSRTRLARFLWARIFSLRPRDRLRGFLLWLKEGLFAPAPRTLDRVRIAVDREEKAALLKHHVSQADVIASYRTSRLESEYLFFEESPPGANPPPPAEAP